MRWLVLYTALLIGANAGFGPAFSGEIDWQAAHDGGLAKLAPTDPTPVPATTFTDPEGGTHSLADWRGKVVLLNFWATWCAPCREEMPSLDRLQQELGSDTFEVVALAVDRAGPETAQKFLNEIGVTALKLYSDTTTRSGSALRAVGMPTTILIDAEGREIGRLPGPYEWDAPEAKALIKAELN